MTDHWKRGPREMLDERQSSMRLRAEALAIAGLSTGYTTPDETPWTT